MPALLRGERRAEGRDSDGMERKKHFFFPLPQLEQEDTAGFAVHTPILLYCTSTPPR